MPSALGARSLNHGTSREVPALWVLEEWTQSWDGWMASPTQWTRVWVSSGKWWWTGRPGVLRSDPRSGPPTQRGQVQSYWHSCFSPSCSFMCVCILFRGRQGPPSALSCWSASVCVSEAYPWCIRAERRSFCRLVPPSGRLLLLAENSTRISRISVFLAPWGAGHPLFWISISSIHLVKHLEDRATILPQTNKKNQKKKKRKKKRSPYSFLILRCNQHYSVPWKKMFSWDFPGNPPVRTGPSDAGIRRFNL